MKCLVIGGTRYFGKHLVHDLRKAGHDVTILTRGQTADEFGSEIEHLTGDRDDASSLTTCLAERSWDVVYDQIGYSPDAARMLCRALGDRAGRLIFTSSQSVYAPGADVKETQFDPHTKPVVWGKREDFTYAEAKRLSEAVYIQTADMPVTCVRIPIVLGTDDYTKRLHFHVDRVRDGVPIYFPAVESKISFISSTDAGRFLAWLSTQSLDGPINGCSPQPIALRDLMSLIEAVVHKKAVFADEANETNHSPFGIAADGYMNVDRAEHAGFVFTPLVDWLPALVRTLARS